MDVDVDVDVLKENKKEKSWDWEKTGDDLILAKFGEKVLELWRRWLAVREINDGRQMNPISRDSQCRELLKIEAADAAPSLEAAIRGQWKNIHRLDARSQTAAAAPARKKFLASDPSTWEK
ncbi:MAG: hypothetical protein PHI35_07740 [Victivallaceae bacterium]|nr:hypothetical protein [Victivallaceae bacterium]